MNQLNMRFLWWLVAFMTLCAAVLSRPTENELDLDTAASGHDQGRVQIKVYRGPTEHDGHEHYAPWGFWVKQPADDDHHH